MRTQARAIFSGSKFRISILGLFFFQKNEYIWGYEDFVDIFEGIKIGLYLEVISMHFRVFSEGQCTEW